MATDDNRPTTSRRIFIVDNNTKVKFLIDTGSDLCVFPCDLLPGPHENDNDLLVDVKNRELCDVTTRMNVRGSVVTSGTLSVKSVTCDTRFTGSL